jgi:release factor H-coupled RctB family protein
MSHDQQLPLSRVRHLFSQGTWIDHQATEQLKHTAEFPGMECVFGMPDLHVGKGGPVGAAFHTRDLMYPDLVGGDIGCGMNLSRTDIPAIGHAIHKRIKRLGSIDEPWQGDMNDLMERHGIGGCSHAASLGTIGGGNHFAELQVVHEINDLEAAKALGIDPEVAYVLVHSGSRGLGQTVLQKHLNQQAKSCIPTTAASEEGQTYLVGQNLAVRYAKANRELIAERFANGLGGNPTGILDICHNFVEPRSTGGDMVWIHRKGAAPSDRGAVVIPGSRGSYSYVVMPIGDGLANGFSLAHGAGRKIPRGQCKDKFMASYSREDLERVRDKKLDIKNQVICGNRDLIFEEHPKAYKNIQQVISDMVDIGIIRVVTTLKPILTYKTSGISDDGDG